MECQDRNYSFGFPPKRYICGTSFTPPFALEFFERRDLFLVSRESGMAFSLSEEL